MPDHEPAVDRSHLALHADTTTDVLGIAGQIQSAADTPEVIELLRRATSLLGADAAMFTSVIRDDATTDTHRCLLVCDPNWSLQYADNAWCRDDPWLRYALYSTQPILARDLPPLTEREIRVTEAAARYGFLSMVIAPAPSALAQSRVGVLCLGSMHEGYFERGALTGVALLARILAMELGDWMHVQLRSELMSRARIASGDLGLLQAAQHDSSSKSIAAALHTEPKTIDSRFNRLCHRLGVANRRAAIRLAEIYGLI
jgi:hypothetical protein